MSSNRPDGRLLMGGMSGILGMLPGVGKIKQQLSDAQIDDRMIARQLAIISSMTPKERRNPQILHASRKRRIAAGCGLQVQDVNRLLKQFFEMQKMMKKISGKGGMAKLMRGMKGMMPPGGIGGMKFPPR